MVDIKRQISVHPCRSATAAAMQFESLYNVRPTVDVWRADNKLSR